MSDNDKQSLLLSAIEHLTFQYQSLQSPCIALLISKHYRLLSNATTAKDKQEWYAKHSISWLTCYISNQRHSQKMQNHLHDFVQLHEFNSLML